MAKTRTFISFDYDHDARQKDLLVGQSKNSDSPFEISDWSIKVASADWKEQARRRIRAVDVVIVLCGHNTSSAVGVATELQIAQEEGKPYFLLEAYSTPPIQKPTSAKSADKIYSWTWDNLKKLIGGAR